MLYTCINYYSIYIEYESSYIVCIDCVALIHGSTIIQQMMHTSFTWAHSPRPS